MASSATALVWGLIAAMVLAAAAVSATRAGSARTDSVYYRHHDKSGGTVIEKYISSEAVRRGYEVVNAATGEAVKTVAGELSTSERTQQQARQAEQQHREQQADELRKWDESLMLRYSSVDEISDAKQRSLHEIDMRINILQNNLKAVKGQIEAQQATAADFERRDQQVPPTLLDNIGALKHEIEHGERRIRQREQDRTNTTVLFDRDIARFRVLMEKIKPPVAPTGSPAERDSGGAGVHHG